MNESCCSFRRISRTRKIVFSTMPAMISRKKKTPRIARTPRRQLRTIQLMLRVTASATRQMPRTVKKITDRRRPLIMPHRIPPKASGGSAERRLRGFLVRQGGGDLRHLHIPNDAEHAKGLERDPAD